MTAILLTAGPVSNTKSVKNTSRSLQYLSTNQFLDAAAELQSMNLGSLVSASLQKGLSQQVFVKISPEEAQQVLGANPHLCSVENYTARYNKPPSKAIGLQLKAKLVAMKLVPKKIFT